MLGSRWLPSAPTSREAGDASASAARQGWASSVAKCREERAAIAPRALGSAPGRLSVDPTRTHAIGGAGLALMGPSTGLL
jgi:hypothetical protein